MKPVIDTLKYFGKEFSYTNWTFVNVIVILALVIFSYLFIRIIINDIKNFKSYKPNDDDVIKNRVDFESEYMQKWKNILL
jgi:hypothetical protein